MKQLSIIIPFYNRAVYLKECLDSILHSECQDFEVIMIDDASTDSGADICREYIMPNNSTTLNLIILQRLAMMIAKEKKMGISQFKRNHPGGHIGEILKKDNLVSGHK